MNNYEVKFKTEAELRAEAEERRRRERERALQAIENDRERGYLVGLDSRDWQNKQNKIIDSFLKTIVDATFDVKGGSIANVPKFNSAADWIKAIQEEFKAQKPVIEIPAKLIKAGKVNAEPFAELSTLGGGTHHFQTEAGLNTLITSKKVVPLIIEAMDPPFDIPKGKTVYECRVKDGIVFYVLTGSTLNIASNAGEVIIVSHGYEGAKAKAARLAAEEAERQRLAEIERMKREAEAEERRQESQLGMLKALPKEKFEKLMKFING